MRVNANKCQRRKVTKKMADSYFDLENIYRLNHGYFIRLFHWLLDLVE